MATLYVDLETGSDSYGTALTDASTTPLTVVLTGTSDLTGKVSKFGTSALDLNDRSTAPRAQVTSPGTALQLGTGPFCLEGWFYVPTSNVSNGTGFFFGINNGTTTGSYYLGRNNGSAILWYSNTAGNAFTNVGTGTPTFTLNGWDHIAIERDASNNLRCYVNGVVSFTVANHTTAYFASTDVFSFGSAANSGSIFPGYISEFRATIGASRYNGAFTPPTAAFPRDVAGDPAFANVKLLVSFDGARTGVSFASRLKTFAAVTAVKIAPGDTVRVMASVDPTLIGNATWNQNSKTVTLAAAVTANIDLCNALWASTANGSPTNNLSTWKEGTAAQSFITSSSFTTGKISYKATGLLDLSAYQQVSFWFRCNTGTTTSTQFTLRLCSDTTGDVTVHTVPLPAAAAASQFAPVTVDLGSALSNSIQSVALYAETTSASVTLVIDNILACKAASSPDSLTLTSLIGKVHNLSWVAATAYNLNDRRRPTQPNRNGFQYQVTTAGTTGSTEPAWPAYWGGTVTDGAVVWTCVQNELEETWLGIQSINGTTVLLDNDVSTFASSGRGYHGATETVATYKRETIKLPMVAGGAASTNKVLKAGTSGLNIVYQGGYDRVAMSAQSGETWIDGQNGQGTGYDSNSKAFTTFDNLNACRFSYGISTGGGSQAQISVKRCHLVNTTNNGITNNSGPCSILFDACLVANNTSPSISFANGLHLLSKVGTYSAQTNSTSSLYSISEANVTLNNIVCKNHAGYGISGSGRWDITNYVAANNTSGSLTLNNAVANFVLKNCLLNDTTPITPSSSNYYGSYVYSQKHQQTVDNHVITADGGTIVSATDQRHTATGISWKFRLTSTTRDVNYPLRLSVSKLLCQANVLMTVSIWTYRDNANIKGTFFLAGGQIAGVPTDLAIDCQPTISTWVQYSMAFTPTESGVVEIFFRAYDGIGTTNNFWIDDISIS